MSEKMAVLFNMIIVVVIASILIGVSIKFFPEATSKITGGATTFIDDGFKRATN